MYVGMQEEVNQIWICDLIYLEWVFVWLLVYGVGDVILLLEI